MHRRLLFSILIAICALPVWALYDPKPDAALAAVQGEWRGSLTYRDYGHPDRMETLPTKLFVALAAPNGIVLHFVFDDGPGKTVYSYERMDFDFTNQVISWSSGLKEKSTNIYNITTNLTEGASRKLAFEKKDGTTLNKFVMELDSGVFKLKKDEVDAGGKTTFRDKYEFTRSRR